jgi:superfamily II DNA/RNA helicase
MSTFIQPFKPFLQQGWRNKNFTEPTAVQQRAIQPILEGKDVICESPTGTGKTLAYVLPQLEKIDSQRKQIQTVIVVPTKELAMQIYQELQAFTTDSPIATASFIGGANIKRQLEKLKKSPQIVVGTPGRLVELIALKKIKMHEVKTIVVDEADMLVNQSFRNEVEKVINSALRDRQLLFFSATIPESVEKLGNELMDNPEVIRVNQKEFAPANVDYVYMVCERRDKIDYLRRFARSTESKAMAFVNEVGYLDEIAAKLAYRGIKAGVITSADSKQTRQRVMREFRNDSIPLLVTTDVASRGLDIEGVTHVIHVDLPETIDRFIHRSGRTGRMGASGTVLAFVTELEEKHLLQWGKQMNVTLKRKTWRKGELVEDRPSRSKE